jgi:hypothetical protein
VGGTFAYRTFLEVRRQADYTQGQLDVMRSGQRPWLGLNGQVSLSSAAAFRFFNPAFVNLNLEGTGVVKNFGASPAFDVNGMMVVEIPSPSDTVTRPSKKLITCPAGPTMQHQGEVVFPGNSYLQGFSQQTSVQLRYHPEIGRVWLLGCIVYHDREQTLHHTWFWLRSAHPDVAAWIQLRPNFRYMPIIGFEPWGQEAD